MAHKWSKIANHPAETTTSEPAKETDEIEDSDAESTPVFKCEQCDYTNNSEIGLAQHLRMRHRISQVDGNIDLEEKDTEGPVPLECDDMGNITGQKFSFNSLPQNKVFHPKAGIGIFEDESSATSDGDTC